MWRSFCEKAFEEFFQLANQNISSNSKDSKHKDVNLSKNIESDEFNKLIQSDLLQSNEANKADTISNEKPTSLGDVDMSNKVKQDGCNESFEALITSKKSNSQCFNSKEFLKLIQSELIDVKEKNPNACYTLEQLEHFFTTDSGTNDNSKDLSQVKQKDINDSKKANSANSVLDEFENFLESLKNADALKDNNSKEISLNKNENDDSKDLSQVAEKNINLCANLSQFEAFFESLKYQCDSSKKEDPKDLSEIGLNFKDLSRTNIVINDLFLYETDSSKIDDGSSPALSDVDGFIVSLNDTNSQKGDNTTTSKDNNAKNLPEAKEININACENLEQFEELLDLMVAIDEPKNEDNSKDSSETKDINDIFAIKNYSLEAKDINDENSYLLNQFEAFANSLNKSDSSNNDSSSLSSTINNDIIANDDLNKSNNSFMVESNSSQINVENYVILKQFEEFFESESQKKDDYVPNDQEIDVSCMGYNPNETQGLLNLFLDENISSSFYSHNNNEIINELEFNLLLNTTLTNVEMSDTFNNEEGNKKEIRQCDEIAGPSKIFNKNIEPKIIRKRKNCGVNKNVPNDKRMKRVTSSNPRSLLIKNNVNSINKKTGNKNKIVPQISTQNTNIIRFATLANIIRRKIIDIREYQRNAVLRINYKTQTNTFTEQYLNAINNEDELRKLEESQLLLSQEPVVFSPKLVKQSSMKINKELDEVEDVHGLKKALQVINTDETLCCDKNYYEFVIPSDVKDRNIIEKILEVFKNVLHDLENDRLPTLAVVNNKTWSNVHYQDNRLSVINHPKMRIIKSTGPACHVFDNIIKMLSKIVDLICINMTMSKRELFYQMKQDNNTLTMYQVDSSLTVISALVDYGPWDCHIVAAPKGMIYGDLTIELSSGDIIMCNKKGGVAMPKFVDSIVKVHCNASFIMIVEKDAVFQEIVNRNITEQLGCRVVVITAKGYPDMNTRLFLKKLWTITTIPAFALVDCDPYGIEIMLRYRFGSLAQIHLAHHLVLPQLKWLGVFPSEIATFGLDNEILKETDQRKIKNMLKLPYIDVIPNLRRELEILLEKGYKSNIEAVINHPSFFFNTYLPYKIRTNSFI